MNTETAAATPAACKRRLSCGCVVCAPARGLVDFLINTYDACERPAKDRRTAHGAVMSDRMRRFHWYLDVEKIPIGDWSTDEQVRACLPKLEVARAEIAARLEGMHSGTSHKYLTELLHDIVGIMQRVPENRSQGAAPAEIAAEVAADKFIAIDLPDEQTGAMVYWATGRETTPIEPVRTSMRDATGMAENNLPAAPSEEIIFTRACKELATHHIIVRRLPKGRGYYLVKERVGADGKPSVAVGATFRLDKALGVVMDDEAGEDAAKLAVVRASFAEQQGSITSDDVSSWLIKTIRRLNGLTISAKGGFYFVPRPSMGMVKAIAKSLEETTGCKLLDIATLRVKDGLNGIVVSMGAEVDKWANRLDDEMTKGFGARAIQERLKDRDALKKKVESYEKLLGQAMPGAHAKLKEMGEKLEKYKTRGSLLEVD